jgi:hypothetical protein
MELYFLGKYRREDVERALLKSGFSKEEFRIFGIPKFRYEKDGLIISLTSPEEGKIQVQGRILEDIMSKGKLSEHYCQLETLTKILMPEKIIDSCFTEYFKDLINAD